MFPPGLRTSGGLAEDGMQDFTGGLIRVYEHRVYPPSVRRTGDAAGNAGERLPSTAELHRGALRGPVHALTWRAYAPGGIVVADTHAVRSQPEQRSLDRGQVPDHDGV